MANLLTIARIALVVPFAWMFFIDAPWALSCAFVIFAIASLTDFLDGRVARARGETSALGAALDPLADKLLVATAIVLLVRNGVIREFTIVAALVIILRELFVGGLRESLGKYGDTLPVTPLAKIKTTIQLVSVGLMVAAAPNGIAGETFAFAATGLFWIAALLTAITCVQYSRAAFAVLRNRSG